MVRLRDRILAGVIACMFLVTTVAVAIAVVWQIRQDEKAAQVVEQSKTVQENAKQLQGSKMQDFTPIAKIDTLQALDLKPGTGQEVKPGDKVTVDYTGAVAATGTIFQSSLDSGQPISFPLDGVIVGWRDGLPGMKVGGTRRLLIPAAQAYGATPPPGSGIPANADLVFDVTLHAVSQ